jgi:hypothetical protein
VTGSAACILALTASPATGQCINIHKCQINTGWLEKLGFALCPLSDVFKNRFWNLDLFLKHCMFFRTSDNGQSPKT